MFDSLKEFHNLLGELRTVNNRNEKINILKKYPLCKNLLLATLDVSQQYYITSRDVRNSHPQDNFSVTKDIFKLLNMLTTRTLTGHIAVLFLSAFILEHKEYEETIYCILDKNLRAKVTPAMVNEAFPGLLYIFKVQQPIRYNKDTPLDFYKQKFYACQQTDGPRCIAVKKYGEVTLYTLKGAVRKNVNKVKKALESMERDNFVLDGELCLVDRRGRENYNTIHAVINRKADFERVRFVTHDILSIDAFFSGRGSIPFEDRLKDLNSICELKDRKEFHLGLMPYAFVNNEKCFEELKLIAVQAHWQGLILREDVPYVAQRTKHLLKVRKFFIRECKVLSVHNGKCGYEERKGKSKTKYFVISTLKEMMIHVEVKIFDQRVHVKRGFSTEERMHYRYKHKELLGKTISVSFEVVSSKGKEIMVISPHFRGVVKN